MLIQKAAVGSQDRKRGILGRRDEIDEGSLIHAGARRIGKRRRDVRLHPGLPTDEVCEILRRHGRLVDIE